MKNTHARRTRNRPSRSAVSCGGTRATRIENMSPQAWLLLHKNTVEITPSPTNVILSSKRTGIMKSLGRWSIMPSNKILKASEEPLFCKSPWFLDAEYADRIENKMRNPRVTEENMRDRLGFLRASGEPS